MSDECPACGVSGDNLYIDWQGKRQCDSCGWAQCDDPTCPRCTGKLPIYGAMHGGV